MSPIAEIPLHFNVKDFYYCVNVTEKFSLKFCQLKVIRKKILPKISCLDATRYTEHCKLRHTIIQRKMCEFKCLFTIICSDLKSFLFWFQLICVSVI